MPTPYKIFLTGGIGDVFALESYLTDKERQSLSTIYYATRVAKPIIETLKPLYPKVDHKIIYDRFSSLWCFLSLPEFVKKTNLEVDATDWSITPKFVEIDAGKRKYNGCSFLKTTLADVSRFKLPSPYIVICPFSTDKRIPKRDFTEADWRVVFRYLAETKQMGVVLNSGRDVVPYSRVIHNLNNRTSILESIEILKGARGYIGIDSCLSILAARHFDPKNILVKSVNQQFFNCQYIYLAPNKCRVATTLVPDDLNHDIGAASILNSGSVGNKWEGIK